MERLKKDLEVVDELTPHLIFKSGMYFGDLALLTSKPRAGTVVTLSDCYFAIIDKNTYSKLLKKEESEKMAKNVKFLKQIPYMRNWTYKEVVSFFEFFKNKEIKIAQRNKIICKEGDSSEKLIIVVQGEVEVVKINLN